MKITFAVIASLASVASAQVTALITPTASAPSGCATSYSGSFEISAVKISSAEKREQKRTDCSSSSLVITLSGGILTDEKERTGYIASNYQFQFDDPPQTGAIYTGGWSVCSNGSLALGGSAVFYECLSGTFYNLYSVSQGAQCSPILIQTSSCGTSGAVVESSDGQAVATTIASAAVVSQISDGQPQVATSAAVISQISDGQIQGATSAEGAAITQISDGQIQGATATTSAAGAAITQISDGQIQGATATATSSAAGAVITQISDGQIQGATSTAVAVSSAVSSQISTTAATLLTTTSATGQVISQISDGQIQATTGTNSTVAVATASASQSVYTGAANSVQVGGSFAAIVGLFAALL